jgi:putative nucleotidyltransferase with HDIG domain
MERKLRQRRLESGQAPRLSTRDLMQKHPETMLLAESLLNVIDQKDAYTGHHSKQDASLCLLLADHLELPDRERYFLWLAGMLHDIGKIGVPDSVLRKPGPLTPDEWSVMCQHVTMGENMVRGLFGIEEVCDAVRCHHERYDGKGYPNGLKGNEIPRLARMLSVVDAYSAMVHDRPYRRRMNEVEAIAELRLHAGAQFDPAMVEAFLTALGRREELAA